MRLDFDPRTSDTFYNYIHVRRPDTGQWQRVYNFGIDVRAPQSDDPDRQLNLIGLCLETSREGDTMRVKYPDPLIQVRQFDDKIASPQLLRQYPDFKKEELPSLIHARGSVEFQYVLDPARPSYTIHGQVLSGVRQVAYIVNGLWVDNQAQPTHEYIEGFPEFDIAAPFARICCEVEVSGVAYAIFYRHDGDGLPYALLPEEPVTADMINFFDNWQCLRDFGQMALNQQYVPQSPPVVGCNDSAYQSRPKADGTLPGVRVVFFPELGWGRGGKACDLRDRIVEAIKQDYWQAVTSWSTPARPWPTIKMMSPMP